MTKKKVFVSGCFDLFHSGHVAFLESAAQYGELYVGIGSDQTVLDLKGRHTVYKEQERKYIIENLRFVKQCLVNSGGGKLDFLSELDQIQPDIFVVNHDGHSSEKEALCQQKKIDYLVLERIPSKDLAARSTTELLKAVGMPYRIDLAGGWLDQPYVSKFHPGPVITISIQPTITFNFRSGMSTSTRNKAIELWGNKIPNSDPEKLAKTLFCLDNPPGTTEISGSQDALGIVMPGLNYLYYNNAYWPDKIISETRPEVLQWLEDHIYLLPLSPRETNYSVLSDTKINVLDAERLSQAASACFEAILAHDLEKLGKSITQSFEAQIAMFPNMVDDIILKKIDALKDKVAGYKISGAGGGGYLILIARTPVEGSFKIKIRV